MARAKPQRTKYPGVYKRETTRGRVYDIQIRHDGKQHWIRGKFTDSKFAHEHRLALLHQAHHGAHPFPSKPRTIQDFAENDWLQHQRGRVSRGKLEPSTLATYEGDLRRHVLPAFGGMRLDRIGVEQVERWQDGLSAEGYSNWYVRKLVTTLGSVLELARRRGLIQTNPAHNVEKPEAQAGRKPVILTLAQLHRLADTAPSVDERNLVLVAAFTALRISELFGLRWPNVSLDAEPETLVVAEQCYQGAVKERAKTPSGFRQIILAPAAAEALRSQQIEGRHSDPGIVFPAPEGGYWLPQNFNKRQWRQMRDHAGLADLHFHDLRHFYVSHIRNAGLPTAITEQLVGHADDRTHRAYTHPIPGTEPLIREDRKSVV